MKNILCLLAVILYSIFPYSYTSAQQTGQPGDKSKNNTTNSIKPSDEFNKLIKGRFIDKDGNEVIVISVPGKPPQKLKEPKAKIPATAKTLANVPAYEWSFGCTPTSASMITGYYDNLGYSNLYTGTTNGGVAPMNNSVWGHTVINGETRALCPFSATMNGLDGRGTRGHVDDYWILYGSTASDPYITNGWAQHAYGDCAADYMKTNQSTYGNTDGSTLIYYYGNGNSYSGSDAADGVYGYQLYLASRGYSVNQRYNKAIYGYGGNTAGFTFAQYKQEIDNGYPVFIHVEGHTMVGIGYDDATSKVYLHDTWDYSTHEMTWGGSYSGMQQWGVSVVHLTPLPSGSFTVSTSSSPAAGGTTSGGGSFTSGQTANLVATANAGYSFVNWTEGASIVSTSASYSFSVTANRTLVANFSANSYSIAVSNNPSLGGSTTGAGTYTYNQTASLQATANSGYTFVNWKEGVTTVSTSASYSFAVTGNRTLVANFSLSSFTIAASCNPSGGGSITGTGSYSNGQTANLQATVNAGYTFVNWTEGSTIVSTNASYSFTVSSNRTLVANFSQINYSIAATSNPVGGGSISGAGSYTYNQTAPLQATANSGYTFVNWTEGSTIVSTSASYSFTVTGNRTLVANFLQNNYTIAVSSNPSNGGSTTGAGSYTYNQTAQLQAIANPGFTFTNWTEGSTVVSTSATYSFSVTGSRTIVANFSQSNYTIAVTCNPSNGGSVTGAGSYTYNQIVQLLATADPGYTFINWTEGSSIVSTSTNFSITVTGSRNLTANFSQNNYTIAVSSNPSIGGTTTGAGNYVYNQTVQLQATANAGYTFVNWTEGSTIISTSASYSFSVTGNRTLVANFSQNNYSISASSNPSNCGSITGTGNYTYGQTVQLQATANTGFSFVNWTEGSNVVSTNANYSFVVNANRTLVANFSLISYSITASSNPSIGGTITGAGNYNFGQTVQLQAAANDGYSFVNWTEGSTIVSTNASFSFTVTGNRTMVANFTLVNYSVSVSSNPSAGGSATGGGIYTYGQTAQLQATANSGFSFLNWTEGSNIVSTSAAYSFTVTGNKTLVANFSQDSYAITANSNPSSGGTITGAGNYNYGQTAALTATANEGYTFVSWMEGAATVSTNATYSFQVTASRTLVANFSVRSYTVIANSNPSQGGTAAGSGIYSFGQTVQLTATANTGYTFVNWTEGSVVVSTNLSYSFIVNGTRTLIANFQPISYSVLASSNPAGGGVITGSGNYNYGETAQLQAAANAGYSFINWTEGGTIVSTAATYSFLVTGGRSLVANFSLISYVISANCNPANGGSLTGSGNYSYGQTAQMQATAYSGFVFAYWTENGNVVSTNAAYSFTVVGSRVLDANFSPARYSISASSNPLNGGSIAGAGSYVYGQMVQLQATANTGFSFLNWTEGGSIVSTNAAYTFYVMGERTLTANFENAASFSGILLYANQLKTPMNSVKVYLKDPVNIIDSTITDSEGRFAFAGKTSGTYRFGFSILKNWGGVNSTDALLIARYSVHLFSLDSLNIKAGDVNANGNVNATDAYLVLRRSTGFETIFAAGNWLYEEPVFVADGGNVNKTIYCLAVGDVNASYNYIPAKPGATQTITYMGKTPGKNQVAEIPFYINTNTGISAASVFVSYNINTIKILSIQSMLPGMISNFKNGEISIAWADINPVKLSSSQPLFILKIQGLDQSGTIIFNAAPECEFSDFNGNRIEGVAFNLGTNTESAPDKFNLYANYPNPFNPSTTISYSLISDRKVSLKIYDMLGKEIKTLVDDEKKAGAYTVNWLGDDNSGNKVSSGIYLYKLTAGEYVSVRKMIMQK